MIGKRCQQLPGKTKNQGMFSGVLPFPSRGSSLTSEWLAQPADAFRALLSGRRWRWPTLLFLSLFPLFFCCCPSFSATPTSSPVSREMLWPDADEEVAHLVKRLR